MSLVSLSRLAAARRDDFEPANQPPKRYRQVVAATDHVAPVAAEQQLDPAAPPPGEARPALPATAGSSGVGDVVKAILAYVPTEIVLVYLAFLNAMSGLQLTATPPAGETAADAPTATGYLILFAATLVATPLLVWLVFAGTLRGAGKPLPLRPTMWPLWEMLAATVAFAAWAVSLSASVPGGNLGVPPALASPVLLVVTVVIGVTAPVFARRLPDR